MVIREESEDWSRCCCAPQHSIFVKFFHVEGSVDPPEEAQPFMTMEREGCDCFCGACPKPLIGCFACTEECSEKSTLYSGDLQGIPGEMKGLRDRADMLGESVQPLTGGGFKPVMQLMDRGDSGEASMFAATRGPCFFGGCSEICCSSEFGISVAKPGMTVPEIHELPFGDFAQITKKRPASLAQGIREFFTDSDIYEVVFKSKSITPQQKANVLATMIHLDYMFFERDNDMVYCEGNKLHIVFFNCFVYGCVCPCELVLEASG